MNSAEMNCAETRRLVPGYLDAALPDGIGRDARARMARHIQNCAACREELDHYVHMAAMVSGISAPPVPKDLGLMIRVAVAQERAARGVWNRLARLKNRAELVLQNILEPLALPATGGLIAALVVFAVMYQFLGAGGGVAMPLVAAVPDVPNNLLLPARLETLAGFEMSGLRETDQNEQQSPLLVEATVSAAGQAVSYRVISGQVDLAVRRDLDQVLLFSRFRPALSFGRPTSGGRVVLSFSKINVRG
jgi:hypothetical protein